MIAYCSSLFCSLTQIEESKLDEIGELKLKDIVKELHNDRKLFKLLDFPIDTHSNMNDEDDSKDLIVETSKNMTHMGYRERQKHFKQLASTFRTLSNGNHQNNGWQSNASANNNSDNAEESTNSRH